MEQSATQPGASLVPVPLVGQLPQDLGRCLTEEEKWQAKLGRLNDPVALAHIEQCYQCRQDISFLPGG